jgi:hypothetical protein
MVNLLSNRGGKVAGHFALIREEVQKYIVSLVFHQSSRSCARLLPIKVVCVIAHRSDRGCLHRRPPITPSRTSVVPECCRLRAPTLG